MLGAWWSRNGSPRPISVTSATRPSTSVDPAVGVADHQPVRVHGPDGVRDTARSRDPPELRDHEFTPRPTVRLTRRPCKRFHHDTRLEAVDHVQGATEGGGWRGNESTAPART